MPAGADRLSLYARVVALLRERRVAFAVVGAAALAVHGISRATRREGVEVTIRRGDPDDPLAGVLKLYAAGPQDARDIAQLLEAGDRSTLVAEIEATLPALPDDSRRLWARVVESR